MGTIMNIRRGGGATGCALEVTGVKTGDTVLLQKGDKSYTKILDNSKKAMFRGLTGGTWTAKMSNGTQNVQREVKITDNYELTVKFFAATISVTYPAGSTCTCTFSHEGETIKTYTAPDTSGSYTFTVSNAADWVVSCTNGTQTASKTVSITQYEQSESVVLVYELVFFQSGLGMVTPLTINKWNDNAGILNITNEHIQWSYAGNSWVEISIYGTSTVDLSKYNNVHMTIGVYSGAINEQRDRPHLYVSNNIVTGQGGMGGAGMAAYTEANAAGTWDLNIAEFNSNMYVGVWGGWKGTITRLWLD